MPDKNIYLVCHPQVYNPNKLCYGQSEMALEENFTVVFDWIKDRLNFNNDAAFYSSPLRRCTKLASYLSDENFVVSKLITDVNFGAWEMKEWKEIPAKETAGWQKDFVNYKIIKGECFADVYERAVDFFEDILNKNEHENIVIITHASVIRSIVSYVLDFPLENIFNLKIDYSSISKVTYNKTTGVGGVTFVNLTSDNVRTNVAD